MKYVLISLLLLFSLRTLSQNIDSTDTKRALVFIPVIFRTPETSWGFGGGAFYQFRFKRAEKTSLAQLGIVYTLRKQLLSYISWEAYPSNENYRFQLELGYYIFNYDFFGVGNTVPDKGETYDVSFPRIKFLINRQLWKHHFLGLRFYYDNYRITKIVKDGILDLSDELGKQGGINSRVGINYIIDRRDNHIYSRDGWYLEGTVLWENKLTGGTFDNHDFTLDARYFEPLNFGSLAFKLLARGIKGFIPFYEYAYMGGVKGTRGYLDTKYRDNYSIELNGEWRIPIWRFIRGVVFAGAGQVASKVSAYKLNRFHPAGGLGLRFGISKHDPFNIGFDVAYAEKSLSYYLNFGESF